MSDIFDVGTCDPSFLLCLNSRRCWFPANPSDPSNVGEAWISGTVTKRTIGSNGEDVTLIFDLEKGDVKKIRPCLANTMNIGTDNTNNTYCTEDGWRQEYPRATESAYS